MNDGMAIVFKWLWRALFAVWAIDAAACFYFKSRAIDEMHDPHCCENAVVFASLTDRPVMISHATAFGYHLTEWLFFGCFVLAALLHAANDHLMRKAGSSVKGS